MLVHTMRDPKLPTRVVVMGAAGFVGRAVADRLERDGISVLRLTRHDVDLLAPDAERRLTERLRAGDVFVAVAARAPCKDTEMLRDNMAMAFAMVKAAAHQQLSQVINISSDAVYADSTEALTEQSPRAPQTLHGVMHLARELMFASDVKHPLAILRPTLIYGAADTHDGYGPNRFRRLANGGKPIILFGEGEERRDHVLIDDVAELVARVVMNRSTGTLNIATGGVASFREIANIVTQLAARPVAIRTTTRVGPMPHNGYRAFDIAACDAAFPDFKYVPLAQGLARVQAEEFPLDSR